MTLAPSVPAAPPAKPAPSVENAPAISAPVALAAEPRGVESVLDLRSGGGRTVPAEPVSWVIAAAARREVRESAVKVIATAAVSNGEPRVPGTAAASPLTAAATVVNPQTPQAAAIIGDIFGAIGGAIQTGVQTAVNVVQTTVRVIVDAVQTAVRVTVDAVQTAVRVTVDAVQTAVRVTIKYCGRLCDAGVAWLTGVSSWLANLLGIGGSITSSELTPTAALYSVLRDLTAVDNSNNFFLEPVLGADGTERLVVFLGGTELGNESTGVLKNLPSWKGKVKDYQKNQVLELLNGDKNQPIMLVGYSQGGMDAQNLAEYLHGQGYNVQAVVAFGSPEVRTPSSGYQTIFIKDIRDPVASLRQENVSVPDSNLFRGYASTVQGPGFGDVHGNVQTYIDIGKKFDANPGYTDVKEIINKFASGTAQVRVVLTWGNTPRDLDSHLTGPASTTDPANRFHVYFSSKTFDLDGGIKAASLDLDDTTSYGPEVTTIRVKTPGDYYFYVDNYSRDSETGLAQSGATVAVYTGATVAVYTVNEASRGVYWSVCKLTVKANGDVTITPINVYGVSPVDGGVTSSV